MYKIRPNAKMLLVGVAMVIVGVCGYRYIYVPFDLGREIKQASYRANAAIEKYPFIETTLDKLSTRLAEQGEFLGNDRKWSTVISGDARSFSAQMLARDFLVQHQVLTRGSVEDFVYLHVEQVRADIATMPTEKRNEDALLAMQEFSILANRLYEICEINDQFCDSAPETEAIYAWKEWFRSSVAARDYYVAHNENSHRIEVKPLPKAFVTICNLSPYPSRHLLISAKEDEVQRVGDWFDLRAGECHRRMDVFFDGEPSFHVHSNIGLEARASLAYIDDILERQSISGGVADEYQALHAIDFEAWGRTLACAEREEVLVVAPSKIITDCTAGKYYGRFSPAYILDDSQEWYYFFENPNFPLYQVSEDVPYAIRVAQRLAQQLANAVYRQQFFAREWSSEIPFSPGGDLQDYNGPLTEGVQITGAAPSDLYGRPLGLQSGDVITAINDQPVYGIADAYQLLINHGLSRDHGIEVPVKYLVYRGSEGILPLEATYFFNPNFRSNSADQSGVAFWYGVGDAIAFGQIPEITCYGGVVGLFALNLLNGALDGASSWINDRPFNKYSLNTFEYYDAEECNWQKHQNRALARQMRDDVYHDSQWFAVLSPSAIRMLGGKALTRSVQRQVGRTVGTRLSGAALELVESSLWSFGTEPPGTPIAERLSSIKKFAPLAAAGGAAPLPTLGMLATTHALKQNAIGFMGE